MEIAIWLIGWFFVSGIMVLITELIIGSSEGKPNPDKTRQNRLLIYFMILMLIACYIEYSNNKRFNTILKEREEFVQEIIDDAIDLEDVEDAWDDREWDIE